MRRIATPLAAAALAGALLAPAPAHAAESPLPQLTQGICQAQSAELPSKASVLVGPFVRGAERMVPAEAPQSVQAPQSPQLCANR